jgi:hypothetical protein
VKIRVNYTINLTDHDIACYCRYYGKKYRNHRHAASDIRRALEQVGGEGLDEILREGDESLNEEQHKEES